MQLMLSERCFLNFILMLYLEKGVKLSLLDVELFFLSNSFIIFSQFSKIFMGASLIEQFKSISIHKP